MKFKLNLQTLITVGLVLVLLWCLLYGCRLDFEFLENQKQAECSAYDNQVSCTDNQDCMWDNNGCVPNPVDQTSDSTQLASTAYAS